MTQPKSYIEFPQQELRDLERKERHMALYFALACLVIVGVMTYAILHIEVIYAPLSNK